MIGETGSGKSSFLRTFTTALMSNTDIKDNYRVGPREGRETSVTKRVKFYVKHCFLIFINIFFLKKKNVLLTLLDMVYYISVSWIYSHQILNSSICLLQPEQIFNILIEDTKNVYNI